MIDEIFNITTEPFEVIEKNPEYLFIIKHLSNNKCDINIYTIIYTIYYDIYDIYRFIPIVFTLSSLILLN